jgi:hypothetical protein
MYAALPGDDSDDDAVAYSDIDLFSPVGKKPAIFTHRDGTPYEDIKRRGSETD